MTPDIDRDNCLIRDQKIDRDPITHVDRNGVIVAQSAFELM